MAADAASQKSGIEAGKRAASRAAVDEFLVPRPDGSVIPLGIGSGTTIPYAVERIAERVRDEKLRVVCVPTSHQALATIVQYGLTLSALEQHPLLDVCFDGADEVDAQLNCIKGGGGCQLQEKIVAANARRFVIVADGRKEAVRLGDRWQRGVPISVVPMAAKPVMNHISETGGKPRIRMSSDKVGPLVTDDGHFCIDADYGVIEDPALLNRRLRQIVGVVETGLFCGLATKAFFGHADGSVTTRTAPVPPPWTRVLNNAAQASGVGAPESLYLDVVTGLHAWPNDAEGTLPQGWAVRRQDTLLLGFAADLCSHPDAPSLDQMAPPGSPGLSRSKKIAKTNDSGVVYINMYTGEQQKTRPTKAASAEPLTNGSAKRQRTE